MEKVNYMNSWSTDEVGGVGESRNTEGSRETMGRCGI